MAVPGLIESGRNRLVAMASRRPEAAEADRVKWGADKAYGSYQALLDDPDIDAVYIPLPNHLHTEWVVKAVEAGKHVLCEKPLVLTMEEMATIEAAAKRTGKVVMEAFMYRFAPRWERAIELLREGAVGEPRLVRVTMGFKQFYDSYNIRFDPAVGGGVLWDMGCYAVNKSRLLFGLEPVSVYCSAWDRPGESVDTTTSGILDFGEGRRSVFSVSFDHVNPLSQIDVIGTEGWLAFQGTGTRDEPLTRLLRHRYGDEVFLDGIEPVVEEFPQASMFAAEFAEMARVVLDGDPMRHGLEDARNNTHVLLKLIESSKSGRRVDL